MNPIDNGRSMKNNPYTTNDTNDIPFRPNADSLGTPMEEERLAAARRERFYERAFRIGGAIIILGVFTGIFSSARTFL